VLKCFLSLLPPPSRLCFRRCLSVCLSVCLLATLCKNFKTDLREIFREGWQWTNEQMIKVWWRSESRIRIRIHIMTLVRRGLAEVCTVPVLLIFAVLLLLLTCAFTTHTPSSIEQQHHQLSKAAADHPPSWSVAADDDDVEHCLLFATRTLAGRLQGPTLCCTMHSGLG